MTALSVRSDLEACMFRKAIYRAGASLARTSRLDTHEMFCNISLRAICKWDHIDWKVDGIRMLIVRSI